MNTETALIIVNLVLTAISPVLIAFQICIKNTKRSKCCNGLYEAKSSKDMAQSDI